MSEKKRADTERHPETVRESPVTYDDYAAMPDDGNRYEVAAGRLELMSPSPTALHQMMSLKICSALERTCSNDYLIMFAPLDVILSPTEVRQPDIIMVHRNRLSIVTIRGVEGAPDLVAEIVSPHSRKRDKVDKTRTYAKYGVPEYWIIDPAAQTLEQYVLLGETETYELLDVISGDESIRSERLPCISFTMNDIMSAIPESIRLQANNRIGN